ncbi:MAG TPA: site-specific DNA-methyltransferase, partial [Candidatus Lokiarchaeia archaeon]|nr:site-specific DNA-methyltransferase [Candidatus Lokiarchaeia archaeon]
MSHEAHFFEVMRTRLVGEQVSGSSAFAHLCRLRAEYYEIYVLPSLATCVDDALTLCPDFREELFEKLLAFFEPRLSAIGSLEPPSVPQNQEKCFGGNVAVLGVGLAYPTRDFFYAKMPRTFQDLTITIGDLNLAFDASALAVQPPREKCTIAYELADVDQENNVCIRAALAERGQKDTTKGIGQQLRGAGVDLPEDALRRAIGVFERQGDADFFLPKDAVTFLQDQLDHWLAPHAFASEVPTEEHILHIAVLRSVALNLIAAIDHFEDQLVQAWTKPKAVVTAHYVITLDKLAAAAPTLEIVQQLIHHANFPAQVIEWRTLGIIDDTYSSEDVVIATEIGLKLNERYAHLPADTQYFPDLEPVLASLFPELDQSLDGWLVKSENFQALCTLLPQFQGAVTAIYIDPPFNKGGPAGTRKASGKGGDGDFAYSVNYQAASWVTLLANRLELAR